MINEDLKAMHFFKNMMKKIIRKYWKVLSWNSPYLIVHDIYIDMNRAKFPEIG